MRASTLDYAAFLVGVVRLCTQVLAHERFKEKVNQAIEKDTSTKAQGGTSPRIPDRTLCC